MNSECCCDALPFYWNKPICARVAERMNRSALFGEEDFLLRVLLMTNQVALLCACAVCCIVLLPGDGGSSGLQVLTILTVLRFHPTSCAVICCILLFCQLFGSDTQGLKGLGCAA